MKHKVYRILTVAVLLSGALSLLNAVPARRGWQTRTKADGSTIELQLIGDEHYHFWETRDGRIAEEQEDGTFVITDEKHPSEEVIAERRACSPLSARRAPKVGEVNLAPRGLVVLAAYPDVAFNPDNTQQAIEDMMNKEGYDYSYHSKGTTYTATGSAADYFKAQSDGKYRPVFDVIGPALLPHNRAYYGGNRTSEQGTDKTPAQMIVDACKAVDDAVDFSLYDNNNDGWIDFVYVIYAGKGEADGGPAEAIWPHNWYVYNGAGIECRLDGLLLNSYACSGEINGITDGRTGIGVICHEFGHVIGLPDYYDTNYKTNYEEWLTPNDWTIMDQGCYNNEGNTPPHYSIFDKYFMGWATPKFLGKDDQRYVRMGTGYSDAYQITGGSSLVPYTDPGTIYYIENRQQEGWDAYLPGHGMIVWQVKYRASAWYGNTPNNTAHDPRYTVIAADGSLMIGSCVEKGVVKHTGDTDPFPGSAGVTTYQPFGGCRLADIEETNGKITFFFNDGKSECEWLVLQNDHCSVSEEMGALNAGEPLVLTVIPEAGYRLDDAECWIVEMGSTNELLVYGEDFTYDTQTNEFRLEQVWDEVAIIIDAKNSAATVVGTVSREPSKVRKILLNGQLMIERDGKRFSVYGAEVK